MRKQFLAAMILFAPAVQAQERWPAEFWNPKPLADDLILPMPCGGAMVFRPVPTPLGQGLLADRPAMLGQAYAETNYSEFLRQSFIAGPFRGADAAAPPRYYIGKYEVTRDQYSAATAEACPTPAAAGRLPQADIAWHEAIAFTMRYSAWLARNARDALPPGGGRIDIGLRPMTAKDRVTPPMLGTMPRGPAAVLSVRDNGSGIATDDLQHIFQPFFSRKGDQGNGLGLSVVAGIVKSSGGALRLTSGLGQGSAFEVFLPLDGAGAETNSAPAIRAAPPAGSDGAFLKGLSVLVVDDNVHVLEMLTGILEHCGAEPGPSLSPADALHAFTSDPQGWSLVVTDYDMPEFNGAELARSVRRIRPDIPILLCTALPEAHRQSAADLFDAVIGKPVAMESFVAAAAAAMAAPDGLPIEAPRAAGAMRRRSITSAVPSASPPWAQNGPYHGSILKTLSRHSVN
jgi:CheY-like chemotaxis protein